MARGRGSQRGEVEVVAALLMAAVVVGGFALLWIWFYPSYRSWEQRLARSLVEAEAAARERLVLEALRCRGGTLNVTLLNSGDIALRVIAVYVNESLVWRGALDLAPGASASVTASLSCGRLYTLKACTLRGNCWTFTEEDPWAG